MPVDASDSVTKDALYPDDLRGNTLEIDPSGLMNGNVQFWRADEPPVDDVDDAKHGLWLPVDSAEHGETWAAAPRDLRAQLVDLEPGDIFEVLSMEKSHDGETAKWHAEIAVINDG